MATTSASLQPGLMAGTGYDQNFCFCRCGSALAARRATSAPRWRWGPATPLAPCSTPGDSEANRDCEHRVLVGWQQADRAAVFELGRTCDGDGRWAADSIGLRGTVNGPMSGVGRTEGSDRPEMIGIYFRPAGVAPLLHIAISDLTDRAVMVEDLWGTPASRVPGERCGLADGDRIAHVESALLSRLGIGRRKTGTVDIARLAAHVIHRRGRLSVEGLAHAAGVSRQHLTREFRAHLAIGPKLSTRLARFQSGLVCAGRGRVAWADAAVEMGYADQSHMIAEFRQFSALTPAALASREWFHPFIERARDQGFRYSHIGSPACSSRRCTRI